MCSIYGPGSVYKSRLNDKAQLTGGNGRMDGNWNYPLVFNWK